MANTALYLSPPNPVKAQLLPVVLAIQHPLFAQNWHLFAPDPIRTNFVLAVRCRTGERTTPWRDLTRPLLTRHHRSRVAPMGRLVRVQQSAIRMLLGGREDEWLVLLCRRRPGHPACLGQDPAAAIRREVALVVITRVASAACDAEVGRGRAQAVQAQILIHQPPPWSRRHLPDEAGTTRYLLLPWMAYQEGVHGVPWP